MFLTTLGIYISANLILFAGVGLYNKRFRKEKWEALKEGFEEACEDSSKWAIILGLVLGASVLSIPLFLHNRVSGE